MSGRRYNTPAARVSRGRASFHGAVRPPTPPSQQELRRRRRDGLPAGHYGGTWSLAREIEAVCRPLAERIAARPSPGRFNRDAVSVATLAEAVHELVGTITGWIAERDARARTQHLADEPGKRNYAVKTIVDLAQRPALPHISDDMVADGSWVNALVTMAETIDSDLSTLLGSAFPPNAVELRGQQSRSEHLARLLARTLDAAATALERRLTRDESGANDRPRPAPDLSDATDELRKLGVHLT